MGFRFRQRLKIIPGIHLNVSSRGMSLSVGGPGATANFSTTRGTSATVGIPGTGLSYHKSLNPTRARGMPDTGFGGKNQDFSRNYNQPATVAAGHKPVASASVDRLAEESPSELRNMILDSYTQRMELDLELTVIEKQERRAARRLYWVDNWIGRTFFKSRLLTNKESWTKAQDEVTEAKAFLAEHGLHIDWELDPAIESRFQQLIDAFRRMKNADAVWNTISTRDLGYRDRIVERTISELSIERIRVSCDFARPIYLPAEIKERWKLVPTIEKANGTRVYVFPGFFIFEESDNFAVIDPNDIEVSHDSVKFRESDRIPGDAEVIGQTWRYANKDGSPDRRYANNTAIPIVNYARVRLFATGLINEEFMVSDHETGVEFGRSLEQFCSWFKSNRSAQTDPLDRTPNGRAIIARPRESTYPPNEDETPPSWIVFRQDNGVVGFKRIFNERVEVAISLRIKLESELALWIAVTPVYSDDKLVWPVTENPLSLRVDGRTLVSCESLMRDYRSAEPKPQEVPVQGGPTGVAMQIYKNDESDLNESRLAQLVTAYDHQIVVRLYSHEHVVFSLRIDDFKYFFKCLLSEMQKNKEWLKRSLENILKSAQDRNN